MGRSRKATGGGSWYGCAVYFDYPFQNKQGKSCVENLARYLEKEEKIGVVVIIIVFLVNG